MCGLARGRCCQSSPPIQGSGGGNEVRGSAGMAKVLSGSWEAPGLELYTETREGFGREGLELSCVYAIGSATRACQNAPSSLPS